MTKQDLEKEIAEAMKDSLDYQEGTYISVLYAPKEDTFMQRVDDGGASYTKCITVACINGKGLDWRDYLDCDVVREAQLLLENDASWIDYPAHIVRKAKRYAKCDDIDIEDMSICEAEDIMEESGAADFIMQEYKKEIMESKDWQEELERYVDYALETLEDTIGDIDELQQIQKDLTIKAVDYRERLLNTLNDNLKMVSLKPIPIKKYKDEKEVVNTIKEINGNNSDLFLENCTSTNGHILSDNTGLIEIDLLKDENGKYYTCDNYVGDDKFIDYVLIKTQDILTTDNILYQPNLEECKEIKEK